MMGLSCDPAGFCSGECAFAGASYLGCDYYAASTLQEYTVVDADFAVAVANTRDHDVTVTITYDEDIIEQRVLPPQSATAIVLPTISSLADAADTLIVRGAAYRIRATAPVTAYQLNPLQLSDSNDASLLLPTNTWTGRYLLAAWHHWPEYNSPSMFAVIAREDQTTVMVSPANGGTPTHAGEGISADGHGTVMLNESDVLQIQSSQGGDYTGTEVHADKPVQVIAGHGCTAVPSNSFACDHLEESILPIEALGREYVVAPPVQWPDTNLAKAVFVRIVATEANTALMFAPDQGASKFLTLAGDFIEVGPTTEAFVVSADKKILVAQYMVSQEFGYGTSDPSMVLVVPREQFRSEYIVYADPSWVASFMDIVAPLDTQAQVDGNPIPFLVPVAASGLGFAHIPLSNTGDGAHRVVANQPFGVSVYGLGEYGSYWYPGGLDVGAIPR